MTPSSEWELRHGLVTLARSYIGTRWAHMGRARDGIDCIGLVLVPALELGLVEPPEEGLYDRVARSRTIIEEARGVAQEVRLGPGGLEPLGDGDVLIFRDTVWPQHMGYLATKWGQRTLIHSSLAHRKVVEEIITEEMRRKALTAFRFRAFT